MKGQLEIFQLSLLIFSSCFSVCNFYQVNDALINREHPYYVVGWQGFDKNVESFNDFPLFCSSVLTFRNCFVRFVFKDQYLLSRDPVKSFKKRQRYTYSQLSVSLTLRQIQSKISLWRWEQPRRICKLTRKFVSLRFNKLFFIANRYLC